MRNFLNKPAVKNILLSIWVIIIGGICSALGSWDYKNDTLFYIKVVLLISFVISYVCMLAYYATQEVNSHKMISVFKHQNKAFEEAMIGIISICEQSAQNVNKIIHEVIDEGKINLNIWSFDVGCRLICEKIYNLLCSLNGESKDFGICYVRREESIDEEQIIYMNAFFNQNMSEPTINKKRRRIDDKNGYHDVELFQKNKSDIEIVLGKENIHQLFAFESNESRRKNKDKYNQYIAIPVICSKEGGGKMVGLLEIVCLNDAEIAETESEIKEIVSKYLIPFAYLLLLLHKLEKAIIAQPRVIGDLKDE